MLKHLLKAALVAVVALGAALTGPAVPTARAQSVEISFSTFYSELAPYGRWFQHPRWGWVWFPTAVDADWRPYTRGRWVWTDEYGWYWEAEEPFGWAVYHYGRWAYDEEYGWTWVPGTVWGPAWVAFRDGETHVGWAPLPPETLYDVAPSYESPYTEMSADYYLSRWVFVSINFFLAPRVYRHAARWHDNRRYFGRSRNVTRYIGADRRIANRSLTRERVRRAIGRDVPILRVNTVHRRGVRDRRANVVNVYRPNVRATPGAAPPATTRVRPNDRPRAAVRRESVPPSERRRIRRDAPAKTPSTPPSAITKPPQKPTDGKPTRRTEPPKTVAKPPQHAVPPKTVVKPPQRAVPPKTVVKPPQRAEPPKTVVKPPQRAVPPKTVAKPPQTHRSAPPQRNIPPKTFVKPPQAHRAAPPPKRSPPPASKPKPAPNCGKPGQPPCR